MGTWSTALYGGDFACDIRDEYKNFLIENNTPGEALRLTTEVMKPDEDEEEGYLFWLVLADVQWGYGHLNQEIKEKAVHIIESGEDLAHWNSEGEKKSRGKVLDKLLNKLSSPQPAPRKPRKPRGYKCPWQVGDLLTARIFMHPQLPLLKKYPEAVKYANRYVLIQVVGVQEEKTSCDRHCAIDTYPIFLIYDWSGEYPAEVSDAETAKIIKQFHCGKWRQNDYFRGAFRYRSKYDGLLDIHKIGVKNLPEGVSTDYLRYNYYPTSVWRDLTSMIGEEMTIREFGEQEHGLNGSPNEDFTSSENSRPILDKESIKPVVPEKVNPHTTKKKKGLER